MKKSTSATAKPVRPSYSSLDKRYAERVAVSCSVSYKGEVPTQPHQGEGLVINLSLSGCKIVSDRPVTRGTLLTLKVALPDGGGVLHLTSAHVVWVSGCQFSVRFLQISQDDRKRIQTFLWKRISHNTVQDQRPRFRLM
jgi:c-di-GMP-binding flagellar brake protein YcgR